ncbi:uncharacterized protein TNIN_126631 [Trichonephila inaurata madagascariensis]|uniref:Uncharacterized protein n=1 Tax=Trichonephila inaurata madagascariensis TaxID=2747483 RepID=A0A8X6XLR9_9ARAC|nr:uncharacterized protein TNIN_126631 [Trichonephila inaurata madagascariensis]
MDPLNVSLKSWIQWGVGNHERLISINDLYQGHGISLSKALPYFHATGCDYTPAFFRKGKLRPFKFLEKSVEYQLASQEIITDDEDEIEQKPDDNFEKKCRSFDSSSLPPSSRCIINDDQYDFVWFAGEQIPSSVADIIIKKPLLENQNTPQDDNNDEDIDYNGSSDDDDYGDASVFC